MSYQDCLVHTVIIAYAQNENLSVCPRHIENWIFLPIFLIKAQKHWVACVLPMHSRQGEFYEDQ